MYSKYVKILNNLTQTLFLLKNIVSKLKKIIFEIRKYMLCNVSLGNGGSLFLYDRTGYKIVYTNKVIRKYRLSNASLGGVGGIVFIRSYTQCNVNWGRGGGLYMI